MSAFRNIAVVLSANTTQFRSSIATAGRDLESFDKKAGGSATNLEKLGKVAGTVAKVGVVALALATASAVGAAIQFEQRMRNVNSISHLSEQAFRAQGDAVLAMSKTFPQSANKLAEGLYDIASSSFTGADGLKVLRASAVAASAGMSDTATSAKAITAVLNAYGLEADQAQRVGNVLFQGVNVGVMSFEELAGSIGDSVGIAAAASINIEELTGAIATMTLSGISANEASTSLNRTIQSFLKPSDAMASAIHAMGYESGAAMLKTLGLHGTMEKLRTVTGGNIEVLLRYFPEIRAARGALALMANEGENYNKVQRSMNDAQDKGGAMQKTFNEQMKSTAAQLQLVKNNVMATAVAVGTNLLPYVQDGITNIRRFTSEAIEMGRAVQARLSPFLENLRPITQDVGTAIGHLADEFGPLIETIGVFVGIGIIDLFNGLSDAVKGTTKFMVDHREVVAGLVAFYGVQLVASLFAAGAAWDTLALRALYAKDAMVASSLIQGLQEVKVAVYGIAGAFAAEGVAGAAASATAAISAMLTPTVVLGVAAAGLAVSFALIARKNEELRESGRKLVDQWLDGFDPMKASWLDLNSQIDDNAAALEEVKKKMKAVQDDMSLNDQFRKKLGADEVAKHKEVIKQLTEVQNKYTGYQKVIAEVAFQLHTSYDDAAKQIQAQGFSIDDLADGTKKSEKKQQDAIQQTVDARVKARAETTLSLTELGATQNEMTRLAGLTGEQFEAEATRIQETAQAAEDFSKKVGEAWASQSDVVSALGDKVGVTGKGILDWYKVMITDGQKFSENIRTAIEQGYDPGLVARLLQAGPQQAGPLLQAMVSDHRQGLVDQVNQGEKALEDLNAKAVELARLTNRAMNAETDTMAKDLKNAMEISTVIMANGGKTTMDALIHALGVGAEEVKRIADEYGINLGAALDPVRSAVGLSPIPKGAAGAGRAYHIATGGYVDPAVWGDTNADSVPAMVMPDEVVIKKESVKKAGVNRLLHINRTGEIPGYAAGGLVGLGYPNFPPGDMGDTSEAASAQTYIKAVAFQAARQAAAYAATGGGGGMGPQVAQWIQQAMALTGTPDSWFGPLMARVKLESGGNPRAINLWDSNAAAGHPSKGLMQTIDGTFNAYKLPGHGDIWNPVDNAVAAIRYIKARYGDIFHVNPHTGYAEGGLVKVHDRPWDSGGTLAPGANLMWNATGAPETLRPERRDVMPQINVTANISVFIGNTELRGMIRQEMTVQQDRQTRRDRSMADA